MEGDKKVIIGIGILTALVLVGIVIFGGKTAPAPLEAQKVDKGELIRDSSDTKGPTDAKVTLVEFADFQCPACGAAYPDLQRILKDYNGKIRFVHRNFPLPMHANAQIGARAAEAAGLQGKFWEMHDKLFETQDSWAASINPENVFVGYARGLGLNEQKFKSDLQSQQVTDKIRLDMGDGDALGVNATPTLYINGQEFSPVVYDSIKAEIDKDLAK